MDINLINKSLLKIKSILIIRFLIKTDINYKVDVNLFIIGTINDFIWATTDEIINYLSDINNGSTSVHVSNLFIQNWDKNLNYSPKYEYCRNYVQVKWYSMFDDIIKIMYIRNNKR